MTPLQPLFDKQIVETTERIVIDYANLSGRESANRAEFRQSVEKHIRSCQSELLSHIRKEVEMMKEEAMQRSQHDLKGQCDFERVNTLNYLFDKLKVWA